MRLAEIFKKREENIVEGYEISQGKVSNRAISNVLIFVPLALVISCLVVILTVLGMPSTMDYIKQTMDNVMGFDKVAHEAAPELPFVDVKTDSIYFDSLAYLKKNGILSGYEDNTFKPEQEMKRAELIKLVVTAKRQFPLTLNYNSCFKDVKNEWFAPAVCLAKDKKWISGFEDNTFHPEEKLTKAETLKILLGAFDIKRKSFGDLITYPDVVKDSWYDSYVEIALDNGLLSENVKTDQFQPDNKISRGYAAQLLYRILLLQ